MYSQVKFEADKPHSLSKSQISDFKVAISSLLLGV